MRFGAYILIAASLSTAAQGLNKFLLSTKTATCNKMAQKSMRSFFQLTKTTESSSSKKPRPDGASLFEFAGSNTALKSASLSTADQESNSDKLPPSNLSPPSLIDEEWKVRLSKEFSKPYFKALTEFVDMEYQRATVYPPRDQIYSAFNLCPFNDVKVSTSTK